MQERDFRFDVMRIIGSIAVVFIHSTGYLLYSNPNDFTVQWWTANLIDSIGRFAVPLFFMISGALLLQSSNIPLKKQ